MALGPTFSLIVSNCQYHIRIRLLIRLIFLKSRYEKIAVYIIKLRFLLNIYKKPTGKLMAEST